jgi:hypothetical protein
VQLLMCEDQASTHTVTQLSRELRAVTFDHASATASRSDPKPMIREGDAGVITPFNFQRWCGRNALIYKPDYKQQVLSAQWQYVLLIQ